MHKARGGGEMGNAMASKAIVLRDLWVRLPPAALSTNATVVLMDSFIGPKS
jgi:hypothetical protein